MRLNARTDWEPLWSLPRRLKWRDALARLIFNADWNDKLYIVSTAIRHSVEPEPFVLNELTRSISRRLPHTTETFEFRIVYQARAGAQIGIFVDHCSPVLRSAREL